MDDKMREEWNKCWRKVLEDACLDHANYAAAKAGFEYAWRARAAQPVVDESEAIKAAHRAFDNAYCAGATTYQAVEQAVLNYKAYLHNPLPVDDAITVWKNGEWKVWRVRDAELAQNDPDWLLTIPFSDPHLRQPAPVDDGLIRELEALKIGDVKLPKGYNITHPNDAHDEAIDKAIALFRAHQPGKVSP